MAYRSSSVGRVRSERRASGNSGYAADLQDSVVLPPLYPSSKASSCSVIGLRQKRLPGGADLWTAPPSSLQARPARFREWVAQNGLDLERDAGAWDTSREVKTMRPKFQSAFKARPTSRGTSSSARRSRSAFSTCQAVYLGRTADEGFGTDDAVSTIAESAREASEAAAGDSFRLQQELDQLRTGDDAVRFFARHSANSMVKVLYCNRIAEEDDNGSSACNLVIVSERKVKPEHFTISANGVFHVCPGEMSECTPLSEWMQLGMMYSVLRSMPFFKFFAYQKNFQHWRENARYEGFCRQRQRLSRSSFLAKPLFVGPLAQLHRLVTDVRELPLVQLSQEGQRLPEFMSSQLEVRSNSSSGARAQLERKQDVILEVLAALAGAVQQACVELPAQAQSRKKSKSKSIVQEKQEAREHAKRLYTAEYDLASLGSFIKLVDYMFQGARVGCMMDAAQSFSKRLGSGQRMFTVDARFEEAGLVLSPTREQFSRELARLWDGALQVVSSVPLLATSSQCKRYFAFGVQSGQTVAELLNGCESYRKRVDHIEETVLKQLGSAEHSANEQYARYHRIHQFGEAWSEESFVREAHTFQSLSGQIELMSEFKGELTGFRIQRTFGFIQVSASALHNLLVSIPERGLAVMMRLLASLAQSKCASMTQQLSTAIKALDERCTTPQSVVTYKVLCEAAGNQLQQSEELTGDLEDAWLLLAKQGFRSTVEDQLQFDTLRAKHRDLEELRLPQAKAYLASLPPEVVVSIEDSQREAHDWSLTSARGVGGEELSTLRKDLQEEAVGGFKDALAGQHGVPARRLSQQAEGDLLESGEV